MSDAQWRPLLTGELADRARLVVDAVARSLAAQAEPLDPPTRHEGWFGRALFFGVLARAVPDATHARWAAGELERAVDHISAHPMRAALFGGFTGVAWVSEHLNPTVNDEDDCNREVDELLHVYLGRSPWDRDYDLIRGLTGMGVYALERVERPLGRACLARVIERLDETSMPRHDGLSWRTRPEWMGPPYGEKYPGGYFNLGVAHGVPAVLVVLAGAVAAGVEVARARRLLDGAVRWMLSRRLDSPLSAFPSWESDGEAAAPARTAWCYGDPGIAAALLAVADAVDEPAWHTLAIEVGRAAAARRPDEGGSFDAGICHGSAGLALLFHRLWHASEEPIFAEAAQRWYRHALDAFRADAPTGYRSWGSTPLSGTAQGAWIDDGSFLTGSSGIALVLLSGLGATPTWDRILAASVRGVTR